MPAAKRENQLSATKRALLAVNAMEARKEAKMETSGEPIAVIGMGCRFPGGSDSPDAFWRFLAGCGDGICQVPVDRWDCNAYYDSDTEAVGKIATKNGGFLQQPIDCFDARFFGISPQEAMYLDPQQRLLLEVCWEGLEHANLAPDSLFGNQVGVFVGLSSLDYAIEITSQTELVGPYFCSGNSFSVAAGRLSSVLGLTGPCMAVDTSCSSSLVAVHLACQALRSRECELSIAAGANLIISPILSINFSKAGMLAPDGRCKTFDASADGYGRGEGSGCLVLKRLSDAEADHDTILALIKGSAVNQDGASAGLTVPSGPSQEIVIRQALVNANVEPGQVSYIEAHGLGTSIGDPIEIGALTNVFGKNRVPGKPLLVGSVKTNVGHLEAAAGMASLIKVILSIQHRTIPAHLHFNNANHHIPWLQIPIRIPSASESWSEPDGPLIAGVSSFGFSGTNAHIIVQEQQGFCEKEIGQSRFMERSLHLLPLAAKSKTSLKQLALSYQKRMEQRTEDIKDIKDICFTAAYGRSHFKQRACLLVDSTKSLQQGLNSVIEPKNENSMVYVGDGKKEPGPIGFLFTGQGSQYINMGKDLYNSQPLFRQVFDQCDQLLRPYFDHSLKSVVYPREPSSQNTNSRGLLDTTIYAQPALFTLEYCLASLWKSWGIRPNAVMGHSVGEYVAACIAGMFSLEDGLKLIAARCRLMQELCENGAMLSIQTNEQIVADTIDQYQGQIAIAAINGPNSVIISGETGPVFVVGGIFKEQGVKVKRLAVSHGFHSPLVEPMLAEFHRIAAEIQYHPPSLPIYSNVTGKLFGPETCSATYWTDHIRQPVRFYDSVVAMQDEQCQCFIEIGPDPVLLAMARNCIDESHFMWLPSLRRNQFDWRPMLGSVAELYARGAEISWPEVNKDQNYQPCRLPTYPFDRQRFWVDMPKRQQAGQGNTDFRAKPLHPLLQRKVESPLLKDVLYEVEFGLSSLPFLDHHRIHGEVIVPGASHIAMLLAAAELTFCCQGCELEELFFSQPLVIPEGRIITGQLLVQPLENGCGPCQLISLEQGKMGEHSFSTLANSQSEYTVHATAVIGPLSESFSRSGEGDAVALARQRCQHVLDIGELYQHHLGPSFQWIKSIWLGDSEAIAEMTCPQLVTDAAQFQMHPGLIDGCFGLLVAAAEVAAEKVLIPFRVGRVRLYRKVEGDITGHVRLRQTSDLGAVIGDIDLYDSTFCLVARFERFEGRPTSIKVLSNSIQDYQSEIVQQLLASPANTHDNLIEAHIQARISEVVGLSSTATLEPGTSLFDLGIDSVMAVELKDQLSNDFELALDSAIVFDFPTVEALIAHITVEMAVKYSHQLPARENVKEQGSGDDIHQRILSEEENHDNQKLAAAVDDELDFLLGRR